MEKELLSEMRVLKAEINDSLEAWRVESKLLRESVRPLGEYLRSVDASMKVVAGSLEGASRFLRIFLPWILAVSATLLGVSPTIIKLILASSGHPTP